MAGEVIHVEFRDEGHERLEGQIGPNSVIQTRAALLELEGRAQAAALCRDAGVGDAHPAHMIPERVFVRLVHHLRSNLPPHRAEAVLNLAGAKTAEYVIQNRIPSWAKFLLRLLPRRLAIPLLLEAIRRHAWTFAGSGQARIVGPYPFCIELTSCPTCTSGPRPPLAGGYYAAAFERLLRLVSPAARVHEVRCVARGDIHCQFNIRLEAE